MSIEGLQGFDTRSYQGYWRADAFLDLLQQTRAFSHLPDGVIEQWLLARLELAIFGSKTRTHSRCDDVPCPKCHGRGWFGRGQRDCPECIAVGKEPITTERRWIEPRRFDGYDKRRFHASMYELGLIKKRSAWFDRFEDMTDRRVPRCPKWLDDIHVSGDYSQKKKRRILAIIKEAVTVDEFNPGVKGERLWQHDVFSRRINWDDTVIRLAMTFGCVCPITGEFTPPNRVTRITNQSRDWDDPSRHIKPLGFYAYKRINTKHEEMSLIVSPFSDRGMRAIYRAVSKCEKALGGEVNSEWVLAEILQSTLMKRAA